MKAAIQYIILFLTGLYQINVQALDVAPTLRRACLDKSTGELTVYYSPVTDACGSFVKFMLFGRDNSSDPFVFLSEHSNLASSQIQATLPNKKKWELYIAALYACNGTDTLISNVIFIDDTPPVYIEPDSVSVDYATQQVIAGWSKAPEPDIMGYSIFKVDPGTGNNVVIDEKNVLFYAFNSSTFNASLSGNRMALAAYDSCKNGGVISNYHSPVLLGFNTGQNVNYQCTRNIYIQWSAYIGWTTSEYQIFVKDDVMNTWSIAGTVPGSQLNFTYPIPNLGRTYTFFVRAKKTTSSITSTSNVISFNAQDFIKPLNISIGHVSVVNDNTLNITGKYDITASINKAVLQLKPYGSSSWSTVATFIPPQNSFSFNDNSKNTNTTKYSYRLVLYNQCNEPFDSSTSHTSMVLKRNFNTNSWNDYWAWQSGSHETNLLRKDKTGSTWNNLFTAPDSVYFVMDTTIAYCFRVESINLGLSNVPLDTAYSNTICIRVFDTTLVPNSFSPGGLNPVFKITNPNLTAGQAQMTVYSRWGQKLFSGDAIEGWTGADHNGELVGPGFYPYLIEVLTPEKREVFKGTVMVLR